MKNKIGISIPVRLESERFPNKPLALILDLPMIFHVWNRAKLSNLSTRVAITTPNNEIKDLFKKYEKNVYLSKRLHNNGTNRTSELLDHFDWDYFIILQGDEPLIDPQLLNDFADYVSKSQLPFINVVSPILNFSEIEDTNVVKAISYDGETLDFLFRKNPFIKYAKEYKKFIYKIHGLYAISRDTLSKYSKWEEGIIEATESIEQFRLLENSQKIGFFVTSQIQPAVNTEAELSKVIEIMKSELMQNEIYLRYHDK